jgi:UDP-N-acetylglucosamine 3-dehydrogenase
MMCREEFLHFAGCAPEGEKPKVGTAEDATAALNATLAAEESVRAGRVVRN